MVIGEMNIYKTSEIAKSIGIHPNTVRLYEELGLISKPERKENGYRIFTDLHMEQIKLIRTALKVEVLQNGLRKLVIDIIKTVAMGEFDKGIYLTKCYLEQINKEKENAEEAIEITSELLGGDYQREDMVLTRKQTADYLGVSIDALRNWGMNGLLTVKRRQNGYRIYTYEDIQRLKIIRSLRCGNYSLSAILRMMNALSKNPNVDIREVINRPREDEDIISVCDKLLTSLQHAEENGKMMLAQLKKMKKQFNLNPTV